MRALLAALATVIPWIPLAPAPTPSPPLAPPCAAAQLSVVSIFDQGATGSAIGGVVLRNDGAPCSLEGTAGVRFDVTANLVEKPWDDGPPQSDALPPDYSLRAIPTGERVSFGFWWSNWCAARAQSMLIDLPDAAGVVEAPLAQLLRPRCDDPGSSSMVGVTTCEQSVPQPRPSTHLPFAVSFARLAYEARAGSVLHYRVTLRNTDKRPFRFGACPAYVESLVRTSIVSEQHILNCRPAGTIAPGASRVFAMQIHVPHGTAKRRWALFFELGLGTYNPDQQPPGTNVFVDVS